MNALEKIVRYKRAEVEALQSQLSMAELAAMAHDIPPRRPFADALRARADRGEIGLIAEIKRASPSAGWIREDAKPAEIAKAYERGGATCLSVLTDGPGFAGSPEALLEARDACKLPALRKDFVLDPYQIVEAKILAADAVLLIAAILDDDMVARCIDEARKWSLDVLFETHNEGEMERAHRFDVDMVGINNRDLTRFVTELETTERLIALAPDGPLLVSESGIHSSQDAARVKKAGAHAMLVGESLMRKDDVCAATRDLLDLSVT
jgi:indole-3-glycerol phosphate synthase